jgi:hypothetical protein
MNQSLESRIARVKFSVAIPGGGRIHHVNEDDVKVVLSRLPFELWHRLRAVHFNDRARGARVLGYVNHGYREIALCALPPRVGLTAALTRGQSAERFGARRGEKWPPLAIRRYMLYAVLLHEMGHLQPVDETRRSRRLRFAGEKLAEEFAVRWCNQLWSVPFHHSDPVHNPAGAEELRMVLAGESRSVLSSDEDTNVSPANQERL